MEIHEIFSGLSNHLLIGYMIHESMSDYFDFLNLKGYTRLQEHRAKQEMKGYKKLHRYYTSRYNKLIPEVKFDAPEIIPANWFEHTKQDVDTNTKRTAVRDAFNRWVDWEKETKALYQQMYSELVALGEIDTSIEIGRYIQDVSKELEKAECMKINLESVDYAMDCILDEQQHYHDMYKKPKHC